MMPRSLLQRLLLLWCLLVFVAPAWAGCLISASGPALLPVGSTGSISTLLEAPPTNTPGQLTVRFEILSGNADFAGSPSPVSLPVILTATPPSSLSSMLSVSARGSGTIVVRVTWLEQSGSQLRPLHCDGVQVSPNGIELSINAVALNPELQLSAVSAQLQNVREGSDTTPLEVEVKAADGTPAANKVVNFSSNPAGRLGLSANSATTNAQGRAQIRARGLTVGAASVVASLADAPGQTAAFAVVVTPRFEGGMLNIVSGGGQVLALNSFSAPLVVEVRDGGGQPATNAKVLWRSEPPGAGSFECSECFSDGSGRAQNRVRFSQAGSYVVVAFLADAPMVTARFNLQAGGIPAGSTLSIISGDNQRLVPGAPSAPLVVELKNPQGQPLPNVDIQFNAEPAIAIMFNPARVRTDAAGRAQTFAAPQLPGGALIIASVVGEPGINARFNLTGGTSFIAGLNGNQQQLAQAIDAVCPRLSGMMGGGLADAPTDLLARCSEIVGAANGRPQDVQEALNQLLPDEAAPQATASLNVRDSQLRNLDLRLDALRGGARGLNLSGLNLQTQSGVLPLSVFADLLQQLRAEDSEEDPMAGGLVSPWGLFLTGTIGRVDREGTRNNPGFDSSNLSLTGGIDYRFSSRLVAGAAFGYDHNDIDLVRSTGSIDVRSLTLSLYASWASDSDFYLDGRVSYGKLDFELERRIRYNLGPNPIDVAAIAEPDGDSRLLALSFGKNFAWNAWNFGAYVRGELSRIELDGYTENIRNPTGNGRGLGVQIDDRELDSRTATLGARVSYASSRSWGVLLPFARVEWVKEFEDQAQTIVSRFANDPGRTAILIQGDAADEGYGNLGLGFSAVFANGRSAFLQYERRFAQDAIDRDSLTVGGRFEF